jgi:hypothetical protein
MRGTTVTMTRAVKALTFALGAAAILSPGAAWAEAMPRPVRAVVTLAPPAPRLATIFELKLRVPQGQGLARLLLDAGVARDDAAEAARLAAGHCDGLGGCDARVAISRQLDAAGLRVERLVLVSPSGQTVIERRDGRLALNPAAVGTGRAAALI